MELILLFKLFLRLQFNKKTLLFEVIQIDRKKEHFLDELPEKKTLYQIFTIPTVTGRTGLYFFNH